MSLSLDISTADLATLCAQLPVGVIIHQEMKVSFVNPAMLKVLGYADASELLGCSPIDLVSPEQRSAVEARIRANSGGQLSPPLEERLLRKDGGDAFVEVSGVPIQCNGKAAVMAIFRDLSESKAADQEAKQQRNKQAQMEDSLRQAQKMEAIGQLAGGVAHDFNNILMVIMSHCQLLTERLGGHPDAQAQLEEVLDTCEAAATITRQLLTFSRQQSFMRQVLDLNEKVAGTKTLLRRLLPENIRLDLILEASEAWTLMDPGHPEQILLNLCVNARDAMPNGGKLSIQTRDLELDASGLAEILGLTAGPYVLLSVRDSGLGMTEEVRGRIFEPFFTTKALGKGTGMGLATVFGIVKDAAGAIRVLSAPGAGCLFEIYLPRQAADKGATAERPPKASLHGDERVLLVEDESALRRTVGAALRDHGYEVIEARDGDEALAMLKDMLPLPQAVISDVVMPGMNGFKFLERLRRDFGITRSILISGYSDPTLLDQAAELPKENFFQKPMRLEKLFGRLRELLDGPSAAPSSASR